MKLSSIKFLPLLAILALCGCQSVKCKKPVGDAAVNLNPSEWNAKWSGVGGTVLTTRITDAERGIVELTGTKPPEKPDEAGAGMPDSMKELLKPFPPGTKGLLDGYGTAAQQPEKVEDPRKLELRVRTLGKYTLICGNGDKPSEFFRIVNCKDFVAVFAPEASVFPELVKQGKLKGALDTNNDGSPAGCTLESFSQEDCERLGKAGVDLRTLFQEDPVAVFIRVPADAH